MNSKGLIYTSLLVMMIILAGVCKLYLETSEIEERVTVLESYNFVGDTVADVTSGDTVVSGDTTPEYVTTEDWNEPRAYSDGIDSSESFAMMNFPDNSYGGTTHLSQLPEVLKDKLRKDGYIICKIYDRDLNGNPTLDGKTSCW